MSIFKKEIDINVNYLTFNILEKNGRYFVIKNGWSYDLSPSIMTKMILSPYIQGVDFFLREGKKIKSIQKNELKLIACKDWFFNCDIKIKYKKKELDGWIYQIESEYIKLNANTDIWICPYLNIFFDNPPELLYLKLES